MNSVHGNRRPRRGGPRLALWGGGVLLVAAALAWWLWPGGGRAPAAAPDGPAAGDAPVAAPAAGPTGAPATRPQPNERGGEARACTFAEGDEAAWSLTMHTSLRNGTDGGPPFAGAPPAAQPRAGAAPAPGDTTLAATLRLRALGAAEGGRRQLLVQLRPADGGAAPGALGEPFGATMGADCTFGAFGFAPATPPEVRNLLTSLLLSLEVALPARGTPQQWVRRQVDGTGAFVAFYRALDDTGLRVERTRRAYERLWTEGDPARPELSILTSRLEADLDARGRWLDHATGHDAVAVGRSGAEPPLAAQGPASLTVVSRVQLARLPAVPGAPLPAFDEAALEWRAADAAPLPVSPGAMLAMGGVDAALVGLPFAELLPGLVALRRSDPVLGVGRAANALAAWLRANPDGAGDVLSWIAAGRVPEDLQAAAFLGLETAGTPQAHDALVEALFRADLGEENRVRAAVALPDVPAPTAETVEALVAAAQAAAPGEQDDVANAAMLALGVLEANTSATNDEVAALAREAIGARLADPDDIGALRVTFRAVGNSGDGALLEAVLPYLEDERLPVRAGALVALRRIPPEQTADLFGPLYAAADEADLRRTIAAVFTEQARTADRAPDPLVVAEAIAALAAEPDADVRAALIELIGAAAATDRAAHDALVEQFHRESSTRLMALVGRYVPAEDLL